MQPHPSQHEPHQYAPGYSADPRAQLASGVDQFMTRVNVWMAAGVGLTGLVAYLMSLSPELMYTLLATPLRWVVFLAPLIFVIAFASRVHKMSPGTATALFLVYAAINGLTFSVIFLAFSLGSIASVFAITTVMYGALALWGYTTKRDLSPWGKFLFMALIGMIVSGVAMALMSWVFHVQLSPVAFMIRAGIGVLLFAGLTAYDTQRIKQIYLVNGGAGNLAILGALMLYLDFINLFWYLIQLFGSRD